MLWADFYITALMHFSHMVQAGFQHKEAENLPRETVSKHSTMSTACCGLSVTEKAWCGLSLTRKGWFLAVDVKADFLYPENEKETGQKETGVSQGGFLGSLLMGKFLLRKAVIPLTRQVRL